jgi:hypothetical protein
MPDYLAPFLQQLSHGTQVIQQLKQQALQQDQMKFERQQVERQNEMQDRQMQNADIGNLQRLRETARDVPAGGSYDAPSLAQQFDPITGNVTGSTPMRGRIAVDPSKVVNYRTADGKTKAFELMSSDEVANRQLERLRATKGVENTAALEQLRQKIGMETDAEVEKAKRLSPLKQQEAGIIAEAQAEGKGKGEQKAYLLGKQYDLPEEVATFHGFAPGEKFTAKERQDLITEHSKVKKQREHDEATSEREWRRILQQQGFQAGENAKNREAQIAAAATRANVTADQHTFQMETHLRDKFQAEPAVKVFTETMRALNQARGAVQLAEQAIKTGQSTNAPDQTLITALNKILDPRSVVREGEYARTAQGQSAIDRLQGWASRLANGGAGVSAAERRSILQTVEQLSKPAQEQYRGLAARMEKTASSYGLNPKRVLMDFETGGGSTAPPRVGEVQQGYRYKGGDPAAQTSWEPVK